MESDLEALKEQIKKDMPLINSWRSKLVFNKEVFLDELIGKWRKLPLVLLVFLYFFINSNRMKNNGQNGMSPLVYIPCQRNK